MPKFKPIYRLAIRQSYKDGLLTKTEYKQAMEPLRYPIRIKRNTTERVYVLDQVRDYIYDQMRLKGVTIDWAALIKWIKENWPAILKFIITLLIFLEPPQQEK